MTDVKARLPQVVEANFQGTLRVCHTEDKVRLSIGQKDREGEFFEHAWIVLTPDAARRAIERMNAALEEIEEGARPDNATVN